MSTTITSLTGVAYDMAGNPITNVEYRFNGGSWQPVTRADGIFDSSYEPFNLPLNTATLAPGPYTVEARSVSTSGYVEANTATMEFTVSDQPVQVVYLPLVVN